MLALAGLAACADPADDKAAPANKAADIDALARNLASQADAWRDDTDNAEAAADAAEAARSEPAAVLRNDALAVSDRN